MMIRMFILFLLCFLAFTGESQSILLDGDEKYESSDSYLPAGLYKSYVEKYGANLLFYYSIEKGELYLVKIVRYEQGKNITVNRNVQKAIWLEEYVGHSGDRFSYREDHIFERQARYLFNKGMFVSKKIWNNTNSLYSSFSELENLLNDQKNPVGQVILQPNKVSNFCSIIAEELDFDEIFELRELIDTYTQEILGEKLNSHHLIAYDSKGEKVDKLIIRSN